MRIGHAIAIPTRRGSHWSPGALGASLAQWLRSDLGITLGTGVQTWADQSGNGRHVTNATGTRQPAYFTSGGPGNQPYLSFDGSDDNLKATAFAIAQPLTKLFVFRQVTLINNDTLYDGDTVNRCRQFYLSGSNQWNWFAGASVAQSGTADTNTWRYSRAFFNGVSSEFQIGTGTVATGNAGASSNDGCTLADDGGLTTSALVDIVELIVISRALTAAEIVTFQGYFLARYGL